jgi:hypothetical protein
MNGELEKEKQLEAYREAISKFIISFDELRQIEEQLLDLLSDYKFLPEKDDDYQQKAFFESPEDVQNFFKKLNSEDLPEEPDKLVNDYSQILSTHQENTHKVLSFDLIDINNAVSEALEGSDKYQKSTKLNKLLTMHRKKLKKINEDEVYNSAEVYLIDTNTDERIQITQGEYRMGITKQELPALMIPGHQVEVRIQSGKLKLILDKDCMVHFIEDYYADEEKKEFESGLKK